MRQHLRSGRALVGARRALQADQTFQPLEAELDAPSQAVEGEDIGGRESLSARAR